MVAVALSLICLSAAAGVLVVLARRFTDAVDADAVALDDARRRDAASRHAARESADQARILHDTVVNTMAAIASGGPAVRDEALVRERCARDVVAARSVLDGVVRTEELRFDHVSALRIPVIRTGVDDETLSLLAKQMDGRRVAALVGIVRELVTNADKHSGGSRIELEVTETSHGLVVVVRDDGVGFDLTRRPAGRGLDRSVLAPAEEAGWQVSMVTRPGLGCSATVSGPLQSTQPEDATSDDPQVSIGSVKRVMSITWWAMFTIATVLMDLAVADLPTTVHVGTLLIAVTGVLVWFDSRHDGQMSLPVAWLVVAAIPAVYWLRLAPLAGDPIRAEQWLIFPISTLFVGLVALSPRPAPVYGGLVALGTVTVIAFRTLDHGRDLAGVLIIGAMGQVAMVVAWIIVTRTVDDVVREAERRRRQTAGLRNTTLVRDMMMRGRERWTAAALPETVQLLEDIAARQLAPDDPDVRRACADQEHHLRQTIMLAADQVLLNAWFARALDAARQQSVTVTIRTDGKDAPDAEAAQIVGRMLIDLVAATAADAHLTVGWFTQEGRQRLMVVGNGTAPDVHPPADPRWTVRRRAWLDQWLVECELVETVREPRRRTAAVASSR